MGKIDIDPHLVSQPGVDSGALTMLGAIVHAFEEPGEYRGTVRHGDRIETAFYLSVDKDSPVAAADIDLARLAGPRHDRAGCCCEDGPETRLPETHFTVNPRGYVVFRVSGGKGGYSVNLRRADPSEDTRVFNSTRLEDGQLFTARLLHPGAYTVANARGEARAVLTVARPPEPFSGYRPPDPLRVRVTEAGFEPAKIALHPLQGVVFECHAPARIVIALDKPAERARGSKARTRR